MSAKMTRRQFLARTAAGLGAAALLCGGATTLALLPPAIYTPEYQSIDGEENMKTKVLVAYATRCGSTGDVAVAIAEELKKRGMEVDLGLMKSVSDLSAYSAVVLGSAIRVGNWVPEAMKFVAAHQAELNKVPVAIFSVHMLNTGGDETSMAARVAYHSEVNKLVKPLSEAWFAGVIDSKKMSFLDRMITKALKAVDEDKRDWAKIRGWGQTVFA